VQNISGSPAGIFAPVVRGFLVHATGRFETAFCLAGIGNLLSILGWVCILPKIVPLR
jgi:hypothetical protein